MKDSKNFVDILSWNAEIISLWFNYKSKRLITDYNFTDYEYNISHLNMFFNNPYAFGFDKKSLDIAMETIGESGDIDTFYNVMMDRQWVRVGKKSKEGILYFYHNDWNDTVLNIINELITELYNTGKRAYRTDGSFIDLFLSNPETEIKYGWSDFENTTIKKIIG